MRKQLDPRIPILINNNVKKNHRSFIVLVGDKGRDQVCGPIYLTFYQNLHTSFRSSTCISFSVRPGSAPGPPSYGVTKRILDLLPTERKGKQKSSGMSNEAFESQMNRTHSRSLLPSPTFGIPTIRSRIRFWVTPMECWCYKTLRQSHQIYLQERLRPWRVVV